MKTEQQIKDELEVYQHNLDNFSDTVKNAWTILYLKLSKEDKELLIMAQAPTLLEEQISVLKWALKKPLRRTSIEILCRRRRNTLRNSL